MVRGAPTEREGFEQKAQSLNRMVRERVVSEEQHSHVNLPMHSKEKGNHTKEQKDRQCVPWPLRLSSAHARERSDLALRGAGNNNFRVFCTQETRGHLITANVSLSRPACTLVRAMLLLLLAVVVSICNGENT